MQAGVSSDTARALPALCVLLFISLCLNSCGARGAAPHTPVSENAGQVLVICRKELLGFMLKTEGERGKKLSWCISQRDGFDLQLCVQSKPADSLLLWASVLRWWLRSNQHLLNRIGISHKLHKAKESVPTKFCELNLIFYT